VVLSTALILILWNHCQVRAEDGYDAWLRYRPIEDAQRLEEYRAVASAVVIEEPSAVLQSAAAELRRGIEGMLQRQLPEARTVSRDGAIVLVSGDSPRAQEILGEQTANDAYAIRSAELDGHQATIIAGTSDRAVIYGVFAFLRQMQLHEPMRNLDVRSTAGIPLRLVNHWDNIDGSVERGYAGRSIFRWDDLPELDPRYEDYARLLASIGIQGISVNNVNVGRRGDNILILTSEYIEKAAALADVFRNYGIQLYLSAGFDSPRTIGGMDTADPLDPAVRQWWKEKADEIYDTIPDFGGFVVKADSEGQPGPYVYDRDHVDGANMLAEALAPHGGIVLWRTFVYTPGGDRARMASENFEPLDGRFAENVLVQIKNGPIDFQVREPVHPLFGKLPRTNSMMEFQITQEYTGHDIHLCYLVPMWKQILDFDTHADGEGSTVRTILDGSLHGYAHSGITAVPNPGQDPTWMGHHLHMANFYGYGRLAWDPDLSPEQIAEEWVRLTFGHDREVVETIVSMLMDSWEIYENYTSPLGLGVMHDAPTHLYPHPEIRFRYHRATSRGVGWDRTQATGSGYTSLYHSPVAEMYENTETCPDELLLFFHHVPYTHRLHSGKTVIQHIYDTHIDGVAQVQDLRDRWMSIEGRIDDERHHHVLNKLDQQIHHAIMWRDRINLFFFELSGIPDERDRVRSDYRSYHRTEESARHGDPAQP
jgi:alpha-glucuronidase